MRPLSMQCLILTCMLLLCQSSALLALHPRGSAAAAQMIPSTLSSHEGGVKALAFSPDGRTLVSGSSDNSIKVWDAATGGLLRTLYGHAGSVNALAFSPDGRTLASGSGDNSIKVWDTASAAKLSLSVTLDAYTLRSLQRAASDGSLLRTLSGHSGHVTALEYSPAGGILASGSWDTTIKVWDAASGSPLRTLSGHAGSINALAFSPNGRTLTSGGGIEVWDAASGNLLRTLSGHAFALAYSPDGRTMASGNWDMTITVWDAASGSLLRTLSGHAEPVKALAYSPDGRTLASGSSDKTIKVWDSASGNLLRTLSDHAGSIDALAYSPDGRTLASGSGDKTIKVWPLRSDDVLSQYVPGNSSAVAVATGSNNRPSDAISSAETEQQRQSRVAVNPETTPAPQISAPTAMKQPEKKSDRPVADKWALVVGISKFQNPKYNLKYAAKDALDFYNYLTQEANFKKDHVLLLLDGQATKKNILTAFGDKFLPAVAEPDDLIVVFVSTHGTPKNKDQGGRNYIVAHDTEANELYATGVDMDELYKRVNEAVKTDRALIVMDTCYSGAGVPGAKSMNEGANFDANDLAQGSGHLVVTSSSPNQRSYESLVSENGIFTKYLIQSLRMNQNRTDVKTAFQQIQEKVAWEAKSAFHATQTPQLGGEWEGKQLILSLPATKSREIFNPELLQMMRTWSRQATSAKSAAPPTVAKPSKLK